MDNSHREITRNENCTQHILEEIETKNQKELRRNQSLASSSWTSAQIPKLVSMES